MKTDKTDLAAINGGLGADAQREAEERMSETACRLQRERDELKRERDELRRWTLVNGVLDLACERDRLRAAIRNLRDVQGRHHTDLAARALFALLPESAIGGPETPGEIDARRMREHACAMNRDMMGKCFVCGSSSQPKA